MNLKPGDTPRSIKPATPGCSARWRLTWLQCLSTPTVRTVLNGRVIDRFPDNSIASLLEMRLHCLAQLAIQQNPEEEPTDESIEESLVSTCRRPARRRSARNIESAGRACCCGHAGSSRQHGSQPR